MLRVVEVPGIWMCRFYVKNLFPFPLATAQLIGDVSNHMIPISRTIWSTLPIQDVTIHKYNKIRLIECKAGRKYQPDWLHLQSINSIKHQ